MGNVRILGITAKDPYYVIKINAEDNSVIVGEEHELERTTFTIRNLNWLGDKTILEGDIQVFVKIRSAHKGSKAFIKKLV